MLNYKNISSIYEFNSLPKDSLSIYLLIGSYSIDSTDIFRNITTNFFIGVKWIFLYGEKSSRLEDIFDNFIEQYNLLDIVTLSYGIDEKTELINLFLSKITSKTAGISILDEKNTIENDLLLKIQKQIH
jgi:hypothetical protein